MDNDIKKEWDFSDENSEQVKNSESITVESIKAIVAQVIQQELSKSNRNVGKNEGTSSNDNATSASTNIIPFKDMKVSDDYRQSKKRQNPDRSKLRTRSERTSEKYIKSLQFWFDRFLNAKEPVCISHSKWEDPIDNTVMIKKIDGSRVTFDKVASREVRESGVIPERTFFLDEIYGIEIPPSNIRASAKRVIEKYHGVPFDMSMGVDLTLPSASKPEKESGVKIVRASEKVNKAPPLSKEARGEDYELYIAYVLMNQGFHVQYHGVINQKDDGGIDLIAEKNGQRFLIQAKNWNRSTQVEPVDIDRLKLDFEAYVDSSNELKTSWNKDYDKFMIVVTHDDNVSEETRKRCDELGVTVRVISYTEDWPRIKGIMSDKKKIYYRPHNQKYCTSANCQMAGRQGHRWFYTAKEAEAAGYKVAGSTK